MKQSNKTLKIITNGQRFYEFTSDIIKYVNSTKIKNGLLTIYVKHTSCSLLIQENADTNVLHDLKNFFDKLVPMDNKLYKHTTEGKDDMPAHIKSALTNNQLTLSIKNKKLMLGTWQGLYLFEHRLEQHTRMLSLHLMGD